VRDGDIAQAVSIHIYAYYTTVCVAYINVCFRLSFRPSLYHESSPSRALGLFKSA
jgi:hypothetical protein